MSFEIPKHAPHVSQHQQYQSNFKSIQHHQMSHSKNEVRDHSGSVVYVQAPETKQTKKLSQSKSPFNITGFKQKPLDRRSRPKTFVDNLAPKTSRVEQRNNFISIKGTLETEYDDNHKSTR